MATDGLKEVVVLILQKKAMKSPRLKAWSRQRIWQQKATPGHLT